MAHKKIVTGLSMHWYSHVYLFDVHTQKEPFYVASFLRKSNVSILILFPITSIMTACTHIIFFLTAFYPETKLNVSSAAETVV